MKEPRLKMTENEKFMVNALGTEIGDNRLNMSENTIDNLIAQENARKFNNQVEEYNSKLEENNKTFKEAQDQVTYDVNKAEIRPMFSRIIVQPFKVNPFQRVETKGSIIVDAGGYTPHAQINPMTGKYEEQKQFIVTGCVIEVGPDTKYLREGDVIYYRVDTSVPVPFFKQGFISLDEKQVIAVVNEGLSERFNSIK